MDIATYRRFLEVRTHIQSARRRCMKAHLPAFAVVSALGIAMAVVAAPPALAGDHVHHCRSADGGLSMQDEVLQRYDFERNQDVGPNIPYRTIAKTTLAKSAGYCISRAAPKGQRRFGYSATTYMLHIELGRGRDKQRVFMVCEQASSGLPAAYNCDEDIKTLNWVSTSSKVSPQQQAGNQPKWTHNGSVMRIVADGPRRRIEYVTPRAGLRARGVASGDAVFEGERIGNRYVGRAYIFTVSCGPVPYDVSGRVEQGEKRVVVSGRAPKVGPDCQATSWRDDRLVFERR